MDLKQIKELMSAMEKIGIKRISLKEKTGFEIEIEREGDHSVAMPAAFQPQHSHQMFIPHPTPKHDFIHHGHGASAPLAVEEKAKPVAEGKFITSPMVGTLYLAASPEHAPFVKVGDRVEEGTVVCIIEAMKVMNEVKAGVSGTLAEVCLENGHPVEFGTKLFRVV